MISIVIPLYNKADKIRHTLGTVLAQTFRDFEIVIVDDGSTDGSSQVVESIDDPRIRLFSQVNAGVSAARNRGIAEARGTYIAFLDADDEWSPEYLATQCALAEKYPECAVFASNYDFRLPNGETSHTILNHLEFHEPDGVLANYFEVASYSHPPLWTSAVMVRKAAIEKIGGFPTGIKSGEDLLTWARLACCRKIAFSKRVCATYNLGEGYDFANMPPRRQDAGDPVGKELCRLLREYRTPGLKRYIGHWHKMRSSVAIRYFDRREAFAEAVKSFGYFPRTRILPFLVMPFLSKAILRKLFLSHQ